MPVPVRAIHTGLPTPTPDTEVVLYKGVLPDGSAGSSEPGISTRVVLTSTAVIIPHIMPRGTARRIIKDEVLAAPLLRIGPISANNKAPTIGIQTSPRLTPDPAAEKVLLTTSPTLSEANGLSSIARRANPRSTTHKTPESANKSRPSMSIAAFMLATSPAPYVLSSPKTAVPHRHAGSRSRGLE